MDVDWDLYAVVRSCASLTTTTSGGADSTFTADLHPQEPFHGQILSFPNQFEARNDTEELHELYKPFFPKSQPVSQQIKLKQQQEQHLKPKKSHTGSVTTASSSTTSHNSRSKRRKNQLKRVCQIPAEGLSSDVWAWRKYGQKPIKGSPYPRGYYRCSTSKGCSARKQVERHRSDPNMFIVTYTGEHNHAAPTHRNSLAGSTRQKSFTPQSGATGDSIIPSSAKNVESSSPATSVDEEVVVMKVDSREDLVEDEGEDDFGMSDTAVSEDFFEGLEGIAEMVAGGCCSDDFTTSFDIPWIANSAATAAGGI